MTTIRSFFYTLIVALFCITLPACGGSDDGDPGEGEAEGEEGEGEYCPSNNGATLNATFEYQESTLEFAFSNRECMPCPDGSCNNPCVEMEVYSNILYGGNQISGCDDIYVMLYLDSAKGTGWRVVQATINTEACSFVSSDLEMGIGELILTEEGNALRGIFHVERPFQSKGFEGGRGCATSSGTGVLDVEVILPQP